MVVVELLGLQERDHVVDHLDNLVEAASAEGLLAAQGQGDELQADLVLLAQALHDRVDVVEGGVAHGRSALLHLEQARAGARQGLLEEVERVVVVEHLDGVRQGHELLGAHLGALLPLARLRRAAVLQLREELLVLQQALGRVVEVLLHGHELHAELADLGGLRLDGRGERLDLLGLGSDKPLEGSDGLVLCRRRVLQGRLHGVASAADKWAQR